MLDDPLQPVPSQVLHERLPLLVAEACAWAVGLSDRPHVVRRHGRLVPSGTTLGERAATGHPLGDDDGRLDLSDARPGSFADALNALTPEGAVLADRFDAEVLAPFVAQTCVAAAERARSEAPAAWAELLDELGDDGDDPLEVARAAEWDTRLQLEAEQLVVAALAAAPLAEVEAEGLSLAVVRAAEGETRRAAPVTAADPPAADDPTADDLAGALFLAERALERSGLPAPVPPEHAADVVRLLTGDGVEPEEVLRLLDRLPVTPAAAVEVARLVDP